MYYIMYCPSLYGCWLSAIQTFCLLAFASHCTTFTIPLIVYTSVSTTKDYGPGDLLNQTQLSISKFSSNITLGVIEHQIYHSHGRVIYDYIQQKIHQHHPVTKVPSPYKKLEQVQE